MNTELKKLIDENYRVVNEMFVFGNLPVDETLRDEMVCPVVSEEFRTMAQLRAYLESIYTPEETDRILREGGYGEEPLDVEKDGALFLDLNWVTGGAPEAWKSWTAEPEDLPTDGTEADITVAASFDVPESDEEEDNEDRMTTGTYRFHAVYTPNGWRLAKMVDTPEEWEAGE